MTAEPTALAELATDLALRAGQVVLDLATTARTDPATKSSATDLVTTADKAAERLIVDGLLNARADDGIQGEEGTSRSGTSGVTWHIDPIDGTTNYVYDLPAYSVSIAAERAGSVVAGVVYDPVHGLLYAAVQGKGATRNGSPIHCSDKDDQATALVATGFSYLPECRRHQAQVLVEVLPLVRDIRRFGSAALDLCAVATGQVDAYYELGLNQWDLAAGVLVAREAGAVVGNLRGGEPDSSFVLAATPALFADLRDLLVDLKADLVE